jgi:DHA2 family multidrug resistance protein
MSIRKGALSREELGYTTTQRWVILFAVMLGTLMQVIDTSIVNVAIPQMMGTLGATLEQISWVSTGYITSNVIFIPLTAWFSARYGHRNYLTISIIIFTVASLLCGLSHSIAELICFRVLQGVGGAALISTAQATIFTVFPRKQQPMAQAIFGIGIMVGPTVGPTFGGWITDNYSWPWVFLINIPVGIFAAVLTMMCLHPKQGHEEEVRRVDVLGMGLLAVGLGCLQVMLERGQSEDWFKSNFIIAMATLSVAGVVSFIFWELRISNAAVNLRVLKDKALAAGTTFGTVLGFGLFGGIYILPVFLQQVRGYSAEQTGWIIFPGAIASAVTMPISGRLMKYFSSRSILFVAVIGFSISMFLLNGLTTEIGPEHLLFPLILRGGMLGLMQVPMSIAALSHLKGRALGDGTALFNLLRQLGGSVGIAYLSTRISREMFIHRSNLVEHVTNYDFETVQRLSTLKHAMIAQGMSVETAQSQALAIIDRSINAQSAVLTYGNAFVFIGVLFICTVPLLLLFHGGIHHTKATSSHGE